MFVLYNWYVFLGDDDYKSGPYSVKFIAEMTSASFNVAIKNNNVLELDENFVFVINTSSLPSDVTVGIPTQATVTIVDDDSKYSIHIYNYIKYIFNNQLNGFSTYQEILLLKIIMDWSKQ